MNKGEKFPSSLYIGVSASYYTCGAECKGFGGTLGAAGASLYVRWGGWGACVKILKKKKNDSCFYLRHLNIRNITSKTEYKG
jgi:hypothetical protein